MAIEISLGYAVDICAVLWDAAARSTPALKLSEVYELVSARCTRLGKEPPAMTTVSGYLRALVEDGVLKQVEIAETVSLKGPAIRVRGISGDQPRTRSPNTGYQVLAKPSEMLGPLFKDLADAYPTGQRLQALLDFVTAVDLPEDERTSALVELAGKLGLPEKTVQKLKKSL